MKLKYHIIVALIITVSVIAFVFYKNTSVHNNNVKNHEKVLLDAEKNFNDGITNSIQSKKDVVIEADKKTYENNNIILNGDFKDGLNSWAHPKSVRTLQLDNLSFVEINGSSNAQVRICQTISCISGHTYRLSFNVKAEQSGAFAILRDDDTNNERYLFTYPTKEWKMYEKDFKSYKDGNYKLYLSSKGVGYFYYSNISLVDVTSSFAND